MRKSQCKTASTEQLVEEFRRLSAEHGHALEASLIKVRDHSMRKSQFKIASTERLVTPALPGMDPLRSVSRILMAPPRWASWAQ